VAETKGIIISIVNKLGRLEGGFEVARGGEKEKNNEEGALGKKVFLVLNSLFRWGRGRKKRGRQWPTVERRGKAFHSVREDYGSPRNPCP